MQEAMNALENKIEQVVSKAIGCLTNKMEQSIDMLKIDITNNMMLPPSQPPVLQHFSPSSPSFSTVHSFMSSPTPELPDVFPTRYPSYLPIHSWTLLGLRRFRGLSPTWAPSSDRAPSPTWAPSSDRSLWASSSDRTPSPTSSASTLPFSTETSPTRRVDEGNERLGESREDWSAGHKTSQRMYLWH